MRFLLTFTIAILATASLSAQATNCPVITLRASSNLIQRGQNVTLTWTTSGAKHAHLSPGHEEIPNSGSITLTPTATTRYELIAQGQTCTKSERIIVIVN